MFCFICETSENVSRSVTGRLICARCAAAAHQSFGVSFVQLAEDLARTQGRMLTHEDRSDGRVISPAAVSVNIHDN